MSEEAPATLPKPDWEAVKEKLVTEAERVARKIGADTAVIICSFIDGRSIQFIDGGQFPVQPMELYQVMMQAHAPKVLNDKKLSQQN